MLFCKGGICSIEVAVLGVVRAVHEGPRSRTVVSEVGQSAEKQIICYLLIRPLLFPSIIKEQRSSRSGTEIPTRRFRSRSGSCKKPRRPCRLDFANADRGVEGVEFTVFPGIPCLLRGRRVFCRNIIRIFHAVAATMMVIDTSVWSRPNRPAFVNLTGAADAASTATLFWLVSRPPTGSSWTASVDKRSIDDQKNLANVSVGVSQSRSHSPVL
jgi:hypothetical protein